MIGTLFVGWILTLFNLDIILIDAINQIFNTDFNTSIYWLVFFIIGMVVRILER